MKSFKIEFHEVAEKGPCYVIAEIGNNHQGDLKTALRMIRVAAGIDRKSTRLNSSHQ